MVDWKSPMTRISRRTRLFSGAVALLALGAAGGASAVSLTRPAIEMAPIVPTAIARLSQTSGVVTVKGRVAEVYGNRFIVQDGSGRTLVDVGRDGAGALRVGNILAVQGHYDDGQMRASYLVDPQGQVEAVVGPPPHGAPTGLGGHAEPGGPHGEELPAPPLYPLGAAPGASTPPPPPQAGAPVPPPPPPGNNPSLPPVDGRAPIRQSVPATPPPPTAR